MNLLVCFVVTLTLVNGLPTNSQEDFGQAMRVFLTRMKQQMECPMGTTPTLAPLVIDYLPLKMVYPGLE